ncbi:sugar transferase [Gammaproteobacteria bacterium]|nr:sugar transferase [Gammaproteobacteria bacterium]
MSPLSRNLMYRFCKRLLDIFISLLALIILLPVFVPIILALRFSGEGEIFYFQKRVGKYNKTFNIYKFATMLKDSENMGSGIYTAKNDSRILPIGGFLRKSKINELPQIINILIGDISLVGPRPLIRRTFELYKEDDQEILSSIKPGLTGIGSIVFRNEEDLLSRANDQDLEEFYEQNITPYKAELEKWYVGNKSFITDILLIFLTVWAILFKTTKLPWSIFKNLPKNRIVI